MILGLFDWLKRLSLSQKKKTDYEPFTQPSAPPETTSLGITPRYGGRYPRAYDPEHPSPQFVLTSSGRDQLHNGSEVARRVKTRRDVRQHLLSLPYSSALWCAAKGVVSVTFIK